MNNQLFRIIFNKYRGQMMVVAENSSSHGQAANGETKDAGSASHQIVPSLSAVSFVVLGAIGAITFFAISPAYGQIVADPNAAANQRPTVLQTANGLPQVNIQTPSAAGVSRNTYSQFDVQNNGAILNNSRTNVQTQQGGWIQANPWLAAGSARVILNEVNSSNPSQLSGYVEVAGQSAEVVIANPAGISVNGGGFINASKATLTTGTSIMNGGSLDSYRVQGGNINISGKGLDLSTTDYAAILARAVQVNAGIWANELKVVTGANQIDVATLVPNATPVTTPIAANGTVPSFALDVAQIGGMYASKILMIGTEAGLGVRNTGTMGSTGGDLVLQNNGWLTTSGTLQAIGNLQMTAQDNLTNTGTLYASNNQTLSATDTVTNSGLIAAQGIAVNSGNVSNRGKLQADSTLNLTANNIDNSATGEISGNTTTINAINTLTNRGLMDGAETQINAGVVNNIGTGRIYGDHLSIAASNLTNNTETIPGVTSAAAIAARNRLDLGISGALTNREHALIYSVGDMAIGGGMDANRHATGSAFAVNNNSATIEAGAKLNLSSEKLSNTNDHFAYEIRVATTEVDVRENINFGLYRIFTRTTYLPYQTASDPAQVLAGSDLTLNTTHATNDASHIVAGGNLNLGSSTLINRDVMATKKIHDVGTTYTLVHVPGSGLCGIIQFDCVREHDEWQPGAYDSTATSTVAVAQVTAPRSPQTQVASAHHAGMTQANVSAQQAGTVPVNMERGTSAPTFILPNSRLYKTNPAIGTKYLIETDTRFIDRKQWLASDYITQALSLDPAVTQKRLGDGFYEQKLIREQVAQLTGRRFLADYTSDEQQYKALMNSAITFGQQYNLRPGIALTAQQIAQLTSDIVWLVEQSVTLPDGSVQKVLVPHVYAKVQPGDLDGSGSLLAGKDVNIHLTGDLVNGGTISGRSVVQLTAENVNNLGGRIDGNDVNVAAQRDLHHIGGRITAANRLSAIAGRDLNIESTAQSTHTVVGSASFSRTGMDRVAGLYVSGTNGTLVASAGRDLNIVAGVVANNGTGATTLSAGNNLNLKTVQTSEQNKITWDADNHLNYGSTTEVGSQLSGADNLTLRAGNDLNARATSVQAGQALSAGVGGNVNIVSGQNTTNLDEAHKTSSGGGFFGGSTLVTRNANNTSTAVASNFGGTTVDIATNSNDINIKGSNVVSDNGTTLTAGGNVNIEATQNATLQNSFSQKTETGFLSGDGIGVSYGTRKQSQNQQDTSTTASASTVGSVGGNVTIVAGNQYKQVGSDVVAAGSGASASAGNDITLIAKKVDIVEAREANSQQQETKFNQSGLTLSVGNSVLTAVQTAQTQTKAATQTSDARMQALAAANIVMATHTAANDLAVNPSQAGGVSVGVNFGRSSISSHQQSQSDTAKESTVYAGGNVNIAATGGGQTSDLTIQGSTVKAGQSTTLQADHQVNLQAAANTSSQTSRQRSSSGGVGASLSTTTGMGVMANSSRGQADGNGSDITYTNAQVEGDKVNLTSGGDTHLEGAVVTANQVIGNVGGNLTEQSLQDTSTYHERSKSSGSSVTVPIGAGAYGGTVSASKTNLDSNYASVTQQSGIKAGDGGFQVNVQGNTDLQGGAITSTQAAIDNNNNSFKTGGTFTTSDIQNNVSYNASSYNATLGANGAGQQAAPITRGGIGTQSGNANSTTWASISGVAGHKDDRTGDAPIGIAKIFDADKVRQEIAAQVTITQEFGKQAGKAIADYSSLQRKALQDQLKNTSLSKDEKTALQAKVNDVNNEERVLNILVGAVTGMGETAVTKESLAAAADEMRSLMIEDSKKFAGVVDKAGKPLSNITGVSNGIKGDGVKLGGTRVDLDLLCGLDNERCEIPKNPDGSIDKTKPIIFTGGTNPNGTLLKQKLDEFMTTEDGKKMSGPTGGVQGDKGTLFGKPYVAGSWQDKLIESFAGTHDMIGGKLSGLYDAQGNIKRGMSDAEINAYKVVSGVAIAPSTPFAAAQGLPPEVWNAISILLKAAK